MPFIIPSLLGILTGPKARELKNQKTLQGGRAETLPTLFPPFCRRKKFTKRNSSRMKAAKKKKNCNVENERAFLSKPNSQIAAVQYCNLVGTEKKTQTITNRDCYVPYGQ